MMTELHRGLRTDMVQSASAWEVKFVKTRLIHGRGQVGYAIHADVLAREMDENAYLGYDLEILGFQRQSCPFATYGEAWCRATTAEFDASAFAGDFQAASRDIRSAQSHLGSCGVQIDAWPNSIETTDGHFGLDHKRLQATEDASFFFAISWLKDTIHEGWTFHYRPKPLHPEAGHALAELGLRAFSECPEFAFSGCYWWHIEQGSRRLQLPGMNPDITVVTWFDAHPASWTLGLMHFMSANQLMRGHGIALLPKRRLPETAPVTASRAVIGAGLPERFDVAVSFAGPQRPLAEELATIVRAAGFRIFYDEFYLAQLWGKNLAELFDNVYRKQSRFCVMFISTEYRDRMWTTFERRSAISKAIEEKGREFILPIFVERVDLEGIPPTIGHLSTDRHEIAEIGKILVDKLRGN